MIFLHQARLLILSQPKTGTTALEKAMAHRVSIAISGPAAIRHVSYRGFMKTLAPWIEAETGLPRNQYLVVSTMREPMDWLGSWYRYRTRPPLDDPANPQHDLYTGNIAFDDFVREICKPRSDRPGYARIKTPSWVALEHTDCIGVDRLFPYEDLSGLYALVEQRTGKPLETRQANVSPKMALSLTPTTEAFIREAMAFEFDLYASLKPDGLVEDRFRQWKDTAEKEDYSSGV